MLRTYLMACIATLFLMPAAMASEPWGNEYSDKRAFCRMQSVQQVSRKTPEEMALAEALNRCTATCRQAADLTRTKADPLATRQAVVICERDFNALPPEIRALYGAPPPPEPGVDLTPTQLRDRSTECQALAIQYPHLSSHRTLPAFANCAQICGLAADQLETSNPRADKTIQRCDNQYLGAKARIGN